MPKKSLHYDFVNNPSLVAAIGPTLSITRATTATVMGSDGYLKKVASGEARFTGARYRRNECSQSENFATTWALDNSGATNPVVTADQADGPDGSALTADRIVFDKTGGTFSRIQQVLSAVAPPGHYVFSVWMKTVGGGTANVGQRIATDTGVNKVVTGDWQRFSVVSSYTATPTPQLLLWDSIAGNDETADVYVWGAQVERVPYGTTTPSDYIATTTAAVSKVDYASSIASHVSRNGLRVEEARTNLCLQSEDFSTTWTVLRGSITSNSVVGPDGSLTADTFNEDATNGQSHELSQSITKAASAITYTLSVYLKPAGRDWVELLLWDASATGTRQWFNVTTGAVGTTQALGAGFTGASASIEDAGNGWYRCILTATSNTATTVAVRLYSCDADASGAPTTALNGAGYYVWGAQLEAGAFPSSYIPTTTASATRNADDVSTTNVAWLRNPDFLDGTFYTKINVSQISQSTAGHWNLSSGSSASYLTNRQGSNTAVLQSFQSGKDTATGTLASGISVGDTVRMAMALAEDDVAAYASGALASTDATYDPFSGITTFQFSRRYGGDSVFWNGHIAEIAYWPERLDNTTLADISSTGNFPAEFHAGMGLGFGKIGALGAY